MGNGKAQEDLRVGIRVFIRNGYSIVSGTIEGVRRAARLEIPYYRAQKRAIKPGDPLYSVRFDCRLFDRSTRPSTWTDNNVFPTYAAAAQAIEETRARKPRDFARTAVAYRTTHLGMAPN